MTHSRNFLSLIATLPLIVLMGQDPMASLVSARDNQKVLICHNAGPSKQIEIEVSENAVEAHVTQHDDTVGACGGGGDDTLR